MEPSEWAEKLKQDGIEIEEPLGKGAHSQVYTAQHTYRQRKIAIKVIETGLCEREDFSQLMEKSAQRVSQLQHANIVQIFGFEQKEGFCYLRMEIVRGENLKERLLQNEQSQIEEAIRVGMDVCAALDYIFRVDAPLFHLQPENIFYLENEQAKVSALSVAWVLEQLDGNDVELSAARYRAPEVWEGAAPDERCYVYSVGAVMFEMLVGRPPFEGGDIETLRNEHLEEPSPELQELRADVPEDLIAVIERALAKKSEERFPSINHFWGVLEKVLVRIESETAPGREFVKKPQVPEGAQHVSGADAATRQPTQGPVVPDAAAPASSILEEPTPGSAPKSDSYIEEPAVGSAQAGLPPSGTHVEMKQEAEQTRARRLLPVWVIASLFLLLALTCILAILLNFIG